MVNQVMIYGRLTGDPEYRELSSGTRVANVSIAYNDNVRGDDRVHFFNVAAFGYLAERVAKGLKKGDAVLVIGSLSQQRWEDKEGNRRSAVRINAQRIVKSAYYGADNNKKQPSSSSESAEGFDDWAEPSTEVSASDEVPF